MTLKIILLSALSVSAVGGAIGGYFLMPSSSKSKSTQEQKNNPTGETDSQKADLEVPPSQPPRSENTGGGSSPASAAPNVDQPSSEPSPS